MNKSLKEIGPFVHAKGSIFCGKINFAMKTLHNYCNSKTRIFLFLIIRYFSAISITYKKLLYNSP